MTTRTYKSSNGDTYRVNEDGSVTRLQNKDGQRNNTQNNNYNHNNDSGGGNSGCVWGIIIAVVVGAILMFNGVFEDDDLEEPVYEEVDSAYVEEVGEEVVPEVSTETYLYISDDDIVSGRDGGSYTISVSTNSDWYVSIPPESWGHITKYASSLTLRIDPNNSSSSRTDYFEVTAGDKSKRINITQQGKARPNGEIKSLRVEHNVYQNGVKGMKVYSTFDVNNLNGQTIYGYVYIYWNDNTTPLHDAYGNNLSFSGYGVANYENCRFTDFCVFVPYTGLLLSPGYGTANLSFDFSIKTSSGDQLDRRNNTKFTMTEN